MSGDIVERLREYAGVVQRDYYNDGDLPKRAADEIERLRAEVESLTCRSESWRADAVGDVHVCHVCEVRRER